MAVRLESLLQSVGQSLLEAQARIDKAALERSAGPAGLRIGVSISETEVDVKMLFGEDATSPEGVLIQPISAALARETRLSEAAVSTLKARLVAVPDEEQRPPVKAPSDVRAEVVGRADVTRLAKILGPLEVRTTYVAGARRWLVDVVEPGGQVVRTIQVEDGSPTKER
jgi:hypothetical protein